MKAAQISHVSLSPISLLMVCGFFFAAKIMVSKAALSAGVQPFQLGVFGNLGAGLCLLPWLIASKQAIPRARRHLMLYAALGLVSFAIPAVLSYFVIDRVGPAYTATIYSLSPLLTMAFAAGLGIEPMFLRRFTGIAIGFAGAAALVQQQFLQIDLTQPVWVIAGLIIPACTAFGNILRSAYWPKGTSALAFSCGTLFTSSIIVALLAPVFEAPLAWHFADPSIVFWMLCFIAISALSYVLNFRLQEIGGAVVFSQIGYWGTGFGALLAAILFGDVLTVLSIAGLACIICGGVLANRKRDA
jgi:drug/metabolite transporter (DMT)-like permease